MTNKSTLYLRQDSLVKVFSLLCTFYYKLRVNMICYHPYKNHENNTLPYIIT